VFTAAGAGVKTNLLFFTKGRPTSKIWYYDLTDIKVGKKTPLTFQHFAEFLRLLPTRADSDLSWTVDMDERKRVAAEEARPLKEQAMGFQPFRLGKIGRPAYPQDFILGWRTPAFQAGEISRLSCHRRHSIMFGSGSRQASYTGMVNRSRRPGNRDNNYSMWRPQ